MILKIFLEYLDFYNVFFEEKALILPKPTNINEFFI